MEAWRVEEVGRGLEYVKGTTWYEGNEEFNEEWRILMVMELERIILRGLKTCVDFIIRCGA